MHCEKGDLRILFVPDVDYLSNTENAFWVDATTRWLLSEDTKVDVLAKSPEECPLHSKLVERGAKLIPAQQFSEPNSYDEGGVAPRFRARQVISVAKENEYDIILTQGLALSRQVAGNGSLMTRHWSILDDHPLAPQVFTDSELKQAALVAERGKLLLTTSSIVRAQLDSRIPAATSKTRLLPVPDFSDLTLSSDVKSPGRNNFIIDFSRSADSLRLHNFDALADSYIEKRTPPEIVVCGWPTNPTDEESAILVATGLTKVPNVRLEHEPLLSSPLVTNKSRVLIFGSQEKLENIVTSSIARMRGANPLTIGTQIVKDLTCLSSSQWEDNAPQHLPSFAEYWQFDLPDYKRTPPTSEKIKVLLAGADFKFAGDIIDALIQRSDLDTRVDLFEANAKPQPVKSAPHLAWADVIIAEFASKNAIWYSQNVRPHQKLIVHLHGYELLSDWIDELNIDACAAIVVASDFYRQKALLLKGWPADKVVVIPNSVNPADIRRDKVADARYHLGIVGIVPILKRPDRALDLLEALIKIDPRYTLHIKGHAPWNYAWEWKKSAHQDSYRKFFSRIRDNPQLLQHIAFEKFSPDMGNWLTKIGWLLSPSTRETFHMAAVEGAISGAIPIAWRRDGSDEILGAPHNVDSLDEAVELVLRGQTLKGFQEMSQNAIAFAGKYSNDSVRAQWLDLIQTLFSSRSAQRRTLTHLLPEQEGLFVTVERALSEHDSEAALAVLDEHIPTTRSATGPLKDIELFTRGLAALDERRFTHFRPFSAYRSNRDEKITLVKPQNSADLNLSLSGIDREAIDLVPPNYLRLDGRYIPESTVLEIQPNVADETFVEDGQLRVDRWIHVVKARIIASGIRRGTTVLGAVGPWWTALPTALAADVMGIRFVWFVDDAETADSIDAVSRNIRSNDFVTQLVRSAFERADLVIATNRHLIDSIHSFWTFDACLEGGEPTSTGIPCWSADQIEQHLAKTPSSRTTNVPLELLQPLSKLRIGLIAPPEVERDLHDVTQSVRRISPTDFETQVTPELDAVIVHSDIADTNEWSNHIASSNPTQVTLVARIFDRARLFGIPTIFVNNFGAERSLPERLFATARKADAIATTSVRTIRQLLEQHPISIRTVSYWDPELPSSLRWPILLRGSDVNVEIESIVQRALVSEAMSSPNNEFDAFIEGWEAPHNDKQLPKHDTITVLIDASSVSPSEKLWQDLANQSLPKNLFEICVVGPHKVRIPSNIGLNLMPQVVAVPAGDALSTDFAVIISGQDRLEQNYLLSHWLSCTPDAIVQDSESFVTSRTTGALVPHSVWDDWVNGDLIDMSILVLPDMQQSKRHRELGTW
ncbi:hypothetical protein [Corynebacterium pseudogenitalium]|uniref:hypothetical protein n=1 Tax=Corynebacterium pseudogenitalium TaxID=38303 RepID=UPI002108C725|nr:hypothetical protein [Corynebacterium pseudogenitalium]UUA86705.1 hypothetical protein KBP54_08025 [Corynebacterium pseudogenitalium]